MPRFTVIVPNYNHAAFLQQRLDSIFNQTLQDFELILLDDASSDNSRSILEKFRQRPQVYQLLLNDTNSGSPFRQWDKAISLARSEWIWIAESDDWADHRFLEKAAETLTLHPEAKLYYCDSQVMCEPGAIPAELFSLRKNDLFHTSRWEKSYAATGWKEINDCLKYDCTVNNVSAWVFHRSLWEPARDWVTGFRYYGDWAFVLTSCSRSSVCFRSEPLNFYRRHAESFLNGDTSVIQSRHEYFRILLWLTMQKEVKDISLLIRHFTYHYLSFGMVEDGLLKGARIFLDYFRQNAALAFRVLGCFILVKLFRKKYPFPSIV